MTSTAQETVIVVGSEGMGHGDPALGAKLLGNFFRALLGRESKPGAIIFYNAAVRLLAAESSTLEALRALEAAGVDLLACITCLEFFRLHDRMLAGQVSNMREITGRLMDAAKVITL